MAGKHLDSQRLLTEIPVIVNYPHNAVLNDILFILDPPSPPSTMMSHTLTCSEISG